MPKPAKKRYSRRNAELAKIHIAQKQLNIDDDTYRDMLFIVAGVNSAADLDAAGRRAVLDRLSADGFSRGRGRPKNIDKHVPGKAAQLAKIEALLTVGGKPWAYAEGIAKRMCKVDKIAWVKPRDLYKIITALRMQAKREGWDLSGEKR